MPRRWSRRRRKKQTHKRCSAAQLETDFWKLLMIRRPGNKRRGERPRRRKQERSENRELRQNDGKYLFTLTDSADQRTRYLELFFSSIILLFLKELTNGTHYQRFGKPLDVRCDKFVCLVWLDNNFYPSWAPVSLCQKVQIQKCAASKVWKLTCPGKLQKHSISKHEY